LSGLQREGISAIGDDEQAGLGAIEVLLDDHLLTACAMLECGVAVGGDQHPLTGGKAIMFDHIGRTEFVESGCQLGGSPADAIARGGHPGLGHDLLGERLGTFQLGGGRARAEAGNALGPHRVGDAGNQGRLRPDDHEIRADLVGQGTDSLGVARIDRVIGADRRRAGVTGGDVHRLNRRIMRDGQGQGMLSSPRSHHQNGQRNTKLGCAHAATLVVRGDDQPRASVRNQACSALRTFCLSTRRALRTVCLGINTITDMLQSTADPRTAIA